MRLGGAQSMHREWATPSMPDYVKKAWKFCFPPNLGSRPAWRGSKRVRGNALLVVAQSSSGRKKCRAALRGLPTQQRWKSHFANSIGRSSYKVGVFTKAPAYDIVKSQTFLKFWQLPLCSIKIPKAKEGSSEREDELSSAETTVKPRHFGFPFGWPLLKNRGGTLVKTPSSAFMKTQT